MSSRVQARASHRFAVPAPEVYDAWLTPDRVRNWLPVALRTMGLSGEMVRVEIDPRVGGRFCFSDMRSGVEAVHWGTYLELERPATIVFTWIVTPEAEPEPSKVTLTILPEPAGCHVTMVHEMDAQWVDYVGRTEQGWSRMLNAIGELLEG